MIATAQTPRPVLSVARTYPAATDIVHDALDLTGPTGLARIALGDQIYTLRITRAGKLILT